MLRKERPESTTTILEIHSVKFDHICRGQKIMKTNLLLITRYSLPFTRYSLLVTFYSLLVTRYFLLVTTYSLLVTTFLLLFTR